MILGSESEPSPNLKGFALNNVLFNAVSRHNNYLNISTGIEVAHSNRRCRLWVVS
jgi:hypothetical protein